MFPVGKATWETKLQPESSLVSLESERGVGGEQMILVASGMNLGKKDKDCLKDSEPETCCLICLSLFVAISNNHQPPLI